MGYCRKENTQLRATIREQDKKLHPGKCKLKIKTREKIRVCYLIFLMGERLPKLDRENWKKNILKMLDIEENYYKSKYKEPVSDFPSDSNQKFAKEMDAIFR